MTQCCERTAARGIRFHAGMAARVALQGRASQQRSFLTHLWITPTHLVWQRLLRLEEVTSDGAARDARHRADLQLLTNFSEQSGGYEGELE